MLKKILLFAALALATPFASTAQTPPTPGPTAILGGQAVISATTTSARVALPASTSAYFAVTILNEGTDKIYFKLGDSTVTATTSDTPLPAGQSVTVWIGTNTYVAARTATTTSTVDVYQATGPLGMRGGNGGTGAGGTPGGSSGQVQYNNAGAFDGMAGTAWDNTNRALTLTGATVTASNPLLNLTQTWNNAAVTFTGIKANVTDTASNASSLLADLQVAGISRFSVDKSGIVTSNGYYTANFKWYRSGGYMVLNYTPAGPPGTDVFAIHAGGDVLLTKGINWVATTIGAGVVDVSLFRDAAGTLAQRNGVNAQQFNLYNTYTDASNFESAYLTWTKTANVLTFGTNNAGTGSSRALQFAVGNVARWQFDTSGNFTAVADNTYDIGASGANRPRYIRAGSALVSPSTTVAGLPSAATAGAGARSFVTDATATTFLSTVAGGGANKVPVVSDGTNWLIGG